VLAGEVRLNWIFTPRMSLQVYLQPYIAVGGYGRFKELAASRRYDFDVFGWRLDRGRKRRPLHGGSRRLRSGPAFSFADPDFNFKSCVHGGIPL